MQGPGNKVEGEAPLHDLQPLQLGESQHVDLEGGLQQLFGDALVGAVLATDPIGVLDPGHVHAERRALLELAGVGAAADGEGLVLGVCRSRTGRRPAAPESPDRRASRGRAP